MLFIMICNGERNIMIHRFEGYTHTNKFCKSVCVCEGGKGLYQRDSDKGKSMWTERCELGEMRSVIYIIAMSSQPNLTCRANFCEGKAMSCLMSNFVSTTNLARITSSVALSLKAVY